MEVEDHEFELINVDFRLEVFLFVHLMLLIVLLMFHYLHGGCHVLELNQHFQPLIPQFFYSYLQLLVEVLVLIVQHGFVVH